MTVSQRIGVLMLLLVTQVWAQVPTPPPSPLIAKGKALSATCVACHGPDGNSPAPAWPKIAGQGARYLVKQLQAFKQGADGPRNNAVMLGFAANLSKADMQALAAYYASQQLQPGYAKPENLRLGEQIYCGGITSKGVPACSACHGPAGRGVPQAAYPMLSGQYAEYTLSQLQAYQTGSRQTDPHAMMRTISQRLSPAEMQALANYIQGLHA